MDRKPLVVNVIYFSGGPPPPDQFGPNIVVHYIPFEQVQAKDMQNGLNGLQEHTAS